MTQETDLRVFIRLLSPARALQEQLEKHRDLENCDGMGDMAIRNLVGLLHAVQAVASDPYLDSLEPTLPPDADDDKKVAFTLLACAQLVAYMEGQIGISSGGKRESGDTGFTGNNINVKFGDSEGMKQLSELMNRVFGEGGLVANVGERVKQEVEKATRKMNEQNGRHDDEEPDLDSDTTIRGEHHEHRGRHHEQ